MRSKLLFRFEASNQCYCMPWDWVEEVMRIPLFTN
jgi:hypothetical protein